MTPRYAVGEKVFLDAHQGIAVIRWVYSAGPRHRPNRPTVPLYSVVPEGRRKRNAIIVAESELRPVREAQP